MSRFLKISLTLVALVVALLVLVLIRIITLDPNDYKERIVTAFEDQTGRSLVLDGEINLELYPWLDLRVERLSIGNTPGFGDTPLLQAENARIRIKTLPLLNRRYEIEAVQLQGVAVNLAVNESGAGNWADPRAAGQPAGPAPAGASSFPLTDLIIGGVDVSDVNIRYQDYRSDTLYQIENLAFGIGELVYGVPIDLSMTLDASTNQPPLSAAVEVSGTLNYDLDNDRYQLDPLQLTATLNGETLPSQGTLLELATSVGVDLEQDSVNVDDLSVSGLDASLRASLAGASISSDQPVYQGEISIAGDDLAQLFRVAGIDELAGRLAELGETSFQLATGGTFETGSAGNVEINNLSLNLLGADVDGSLQLMAINSDRPMARGALNASGPNLPLVIEVAGQLTGGSDSQLAIAGRELGQVAEPAFNANLEFNADVNEGTVSIPILDAQLLGAEISGQLQASSIDTDSPRLAGALDAQGPDLPLMIQIGAWFQSGPESMLFQVAEKLRQQGNGAFVIASQFDADLAGGNIAVPLLNASGLGLQLNGVIDASHMNGNNGSINGNLTLTGNDVGPLLRAMDQPELAEVVERLTVNMQLAGGRNNLVVEPLQADLLLSGPQIPNSPVNLVVAAASRIDLDAENLVVDSFSVSGLGLDASGRLDMEGPFDAPAFSGQLELTSFSPKSLLAQLNQPLPNTSDPGVLERMALSSSFEGSLDSISLEEFSLLLDDTTVNGSMLLSVQETVTAGFELAVNSINLDRYLPPESQDTGSDTESSAGAEVPAEQLRNLDLEGQLQIGELVLSGLQLSDLQAAVNASDGVVELAPVSTTLYRGTLDASATLSVTGAEPMASLDVNLSQVDLDPLMLDLMDASYLSGRGNVVLAVTGSGADSDAIQRSLTGSGSVQLQDGVFRGVDVAGVLRQVETMIRSRQPGSLQRGEQTAFESFSSTLAINNGIVSTDDLLIQSPGFQVAGRGTLLDLSDQSIAFNLSTTVDEATVTRGGTLATATDGTAEQYDIGGYSLPIACSGSLSAPRCLPDAGEILRARLQRAVQEQVTDLLDRSLGIEREEATTPPADVDQQPVEEAQPEPGLDTIRDELINRALDRIFN